MKPLRLNYKYIYYLQAGFSEDEVREHLTKKYKDAGFSNAEINAYFHKMDIVLGKETPTEQEILAGYAAEAQKIEMNRNVYGLRIRVILLPQTGHRRNSVSV